MDDKVTLRPLYSFLEDALRLGVYVRCPQTGRAHDIGDCLGCARYRGLHLPGADEPYGLRCADRAARRRLELGDEAASA